MGKNMIWICIFYTVANTLILSYAFSKYMLLNIKISVINPLTAKLFNLNFHSLEVVSRWRDPQLQVSEKY